MDLSESCSSDSPDDSTVKSQTICITDKEDGLRTTATQENTTQNILDNRQTSQLISVDCHPLMFSWDLQSENQDLQNPKCTELMDVPLHNICCTRGVSQDPKESPKKLILKALANRDAVSSGSETDLSQHQTVVESFNSVSWNTNLKSSIAYENRVKSVSCSEICEDQYVAPRNPLQSEPGSLDSISVHSSIGGDVPNQQISRCSSKSSGDGEGESVNVTQIDMKVIEPFKRVLSHGGYLTADCQNAIVVFSSCFLPDRSRPDYRYVMDSLFL